MVIPLTLVVNKQPFALKLIKTCSYWDFCESLYRDWRNDPSFLSDFAENFDIESLPEPWNSISLRGKPLMVLGNNPGGSMPFQRHSWICRQFNDRVSYSEIGRDLAVRYADPESDISTAARTRIRKLDEIRQTLGFNRFEHTETFFLHSERFDKCRFLSRYIKYPLVNAYHSHLRNYLKPHPVLVVGVISSRDPLSLESIRNSPWLRLQADLAGMDLDCARLQILGRKNGKATTGLVVQGNKFMTCTMGSNGIPNGVAGALHRFRG